MTKFQNLFEYACMDAAAIDATLLFQHVVILVPFNDMAIGDCFEQCRFDLSREEFVFENYMKCLPQNLDEDGCVKASERITIPLRDIVRLTFQ